MGRRRKARFIDGKYHDCIVMDLLREEWVSKNKAQWSYAEFPSFLILPLFMITTLLAVIVYRRKHSMQSIISACIWPQILSHAITFTNFVCVCMPVTTYSLFAYFRLSIISVVEIFFLACVAPSFQCGCVLFEEMATSGTQLLLILFGILLFIIVFLGSLWVRASSA